MRAGSMQGFWHACDTHTRKCDVLVVSFRYFEGKVPVFFKRNL